MKLAYRVLLLLGIAWLGITSSSSAVAASTTLLESTGQVLDMVAGAVPLALPQGAACNGTPQISYFVANPAFIQPGQISTLQWGLVGNANAAYLVTPAGTNGVGTPGQQPVNPTHTTTYTLVAYCGNISAQVTATVNVQSSSGCNGAPVITSFGANPAVVQAGQISTLQWGLVVNADAAVLSTPDGNSGVVTPGQAPVKPNQTTTYALIAWCKGRSVQQQATVTVTGAPPPPPPAGASNITGISVNGGLSTPSMMVLTVNYFWDGQDAPAAARVTPYNANGAAIGSSYQTNIAANKNWYANLQVKANRSQVASATVCLVGRSGTELACANWP